MKLIHYNNRGKELNHYESLADATRKLNIDINFVSLCIKYGYQLPDGSVLKKMKYQDQTEVAFKEHVSRGTLRPKLEKKYENINKQKLKRLIDNHHAEQRVKNAYKHWYDNQGSPANTIKEVAELFETSVYKLSKYIENEHASKISRP